jgi:hypothetical protein
MKNIIKDHSNLWEFSQALVIRGFLPRFYILKVEIIKNNYIGDCKFGTCTIVQKMHG